MTRDPRELDLLAWTVRNQGVPPGHPDDYDPLTLAALLVHAADALKSAGTAVQYPEGPSGPAVTGDPEIDRLEWEFAAGFTPDPRRR